MQTIIVLNPGKLENADMDLRYTVSDRIEEVSGSFIWSNGYDFIDTEAGEPGPLIGIWLETEISLSKTELLRGSLPRWGMWNIKNSTFNMQAHQLESLKFMPPADAWIQFSCSNKILNCLYACFNICDGLYFGNRGLTAAL